MVNVVIPLNSYSFIESLREKLIPNMKCEIEIELEEDKNITWEAADDCRYVIHKFQLWVPKITLSPNGVNNYNRHYLTPNKWTYLQERVIRSTSRKDETGTFKISSGVRNPRHVFVWFLNDAAFNNSNTNIFLFNTFNVANDMKLQSAQLEVANGNFNPEKIYTPSTEMARVYNDVLCYNYSCFDTTVGSQLTRQNFEKLFSFLYFDLRYQKLDVKDNTSTLTFTYRLSGETNANYSVFALTLFEQEVELYDSTGKILIRNI